MLKNPRSSAEHRSKKIFKSRGYVSKGVVSFQVERANKQTNTKISSHLTRRNSKINGAICCTNRKLF